MSEKTLEEKANEAWLVYKETIQSSNYMQRLTLKQREVDFKAGFIVSQI